MKALKTSSKELAGMINNFRDSALTLGGSAQAQDTLRQLVWFVNVDSVNTLEAAWRETCLTSDFNVLNNACDSLIAQAAKKH